MQLDHIVILVSDVQECTRFYDTLLPLIGFTKQRAHVYGNDQGIHLDLRESQEPEHGYRRHAPGLNHLGFTAEDRAHIERVCEEMANAGFEVPAIQEFNDGSAVFLKDSDGMRVELGCYR